MWEGMLPPMTRIPLLCLLLAACDEPWIPPGCGNGVLEDGETCDDGVANSDSAPDACRTDCLPAACGDGVVDAAEACDDANAWGGDGCTPACAAETGLPEEEPNDSPDEAPPWPGTPVNGSLPAGDRDCFAVDVAACGAVEARFLDGCDAPATLALVDPAGVEVAIGADGADGCPALDPAHAPGARFVEEGTWVVCAQGLLGAPVPAYTLDLSVIAPEDATFEMDEEDDPDGDGRPDRCDADQDGDGVANEEDDCPAIPNGPDAAPLSPSVDGFLRQWLSIGPFTGTESTVDCRASEDALLDGDDANAAPALGDRVGDLAWTVFWSTEDRLGYLDRYATVDAPRELYQAVYLRSDDARTVTLSVGPDDGARVWLNGVQVVDFSGCQPAYADYVLQEVTLAAGWNRLLVKIRDAGGDWANYVRFLDGGGAPVLDLEVSLSPEGAWVPGQGDTDGDGIGDLCDETP